MSYGFGRGGGYGRGGGGGMGFGFRGASPPWPYVGRGRGGLPRCGYYIDAVPPWTGQPPVYGQQAAAPGTIPYNGPMDRETELDYLKKESEAVKEQMDEINARIKDLESEEQ